MQVLRCQYCVFTHVLFCLILSCSSQKAYDEWNRTRITQPSWHLCTHCTVRLCANRVKTVKCNWQRRSGMRAKSKLILWGATAQQAAASKDKKEQPEEKTVLSNMSWWLEKSSEVNLWNLWELVHRVTTYQMASLSFFGLCALCFISAWSTHQSACSIGGRACRWGCVRKFLICGLLSDLQDTFTEVKQFKIQRLQ